MVQRLWAIVHARVTESVTTMRQEGIIDLSGLSRSQRGLIWLGYGSVLFFLVVGLFFELVGASLPHVQFDIPNTSEGLSARELVAIPMLVLGAESIAFILGWSLVLTGASDCSRRIFIPVMGLFILQLLITVPIDGQSGNISILWYWSRHSLSITSISVSR